MRLAAALAGVLIIVAVLADAFETVVLPRSVSRRFRLTRFYFRSTWRAWASRASHIKKTARRERFLAIFGPLSLLALLAIWAVGLILGFALLHWSAGSHLETAARSDRFADDLYFSGTVFFTLGFDTLHPIGVLAKPLSVLEGGMGFGFLAIVIAYFPVVYQAFSRREVRLTLLDAWAGSPPAAAEVLVRLARTGELGAIETFLHDWEVWCSELLESGISYPVVAYFRSQHQRQSWVSALTTLLDVSALVVVGVEGLPTWQAHATFAIARHAAVDLTQVFSVPIDYGCDRLSDGALEELRRHLESAGLRPRRSPEADAALRELRQSYEPYVSGLARSLLMPLPDWWRAEPAKDNWQTSPRRIGEAHL